MLKTAITLAFVFAFESAIACSCAPPRPIMDPPVDGYFLLKSYDMIFVGRILSTDTTSRVDEDFAGKIQKVRFEVEKYWNLPNPELDEIVIETEIARGNCGLEFPDFGRFLVFTNERRGKRRVSICSPTGSADSAADRVEALNAGAEFKANKSFNTEASKAGSG